MGRKKLTEGRVLVARPSHTLYSLLTNLESAAGFLPKEALTFAEISATPDTLIAKLQGVELGIAVVERQENKRVYYTQSNNSLFQYSIEIELQSIGEESTELHYRVEESLPTLVRSIIERQLKSAVEKFGSNRTPIE
ncbi:MAG: hypothetical protein WC960_03420 [Bacteroidales bacterium]